MHIGDMCIRDVIVVKQSESVREAAQLMRKYHVGSLIVIEANSRGVTPIGIVTDRDLVVEIMAPGVDVEMLVVGDMMTTDLLVAEESQDLWEVLEQMQLRGVRRVPVVNNTGELVGIFTIDDILEAFSLELSNVVKLFAREQHHETTARK